MKEEKSTLVNHLDAIQHRTESWPDWMQKAAGKKESESEGRQDMASTNQDWQRKSNVPLSKY